MATKNAIDVSKIDVEDLDGYNTYWSEPQQVRAKRLTEDKIYTVLVNGTEQTFKGKAGQIDVFHVNGDGKITKNEPYDVEVFQKRFGLLAEQKELFATEKKANDTPQ